MLSRTGWHITPPPRRNRPQTHRGHTLHLAGSILLVGLPRGPLAFSGAFGKNRLALLPAIALCQQLAYLFGWPDLRPGGEPDKDAAFQIMLLLGVMLGFPQARSLLLLCLVHAPASGIARKPRVPLAEVKRSPLCRELVRNIEEAIAEKPPRSPLITRVPLLCRIPAAASAALALHRMGARLLKHLSGAGEWRCACAVHMG